MEFCVNKAIIISNFFVRTNGRSEGDKGERDSRLKVHLAQVQYPIIFWRSMRKSCWRRQRTSSHNILAHMWQQLQPYTNDVKAKRQAVAAAAAAAVSPVCHAEMKDALNISLWIKIYTGYFLGFERKKKLFRSPLSVNFRFFSSLQISFWAHFCYKHNEPVAANTWFPDANSLTRTFSI